MNIRTLGVFCGILSGFFWGTMDIAAQYLLHTVRMAPAQFISLTMVVTTVALFAISIATKPKETFLAATDKRNVFQFFLFGVLVLLTQVSFYVCVKYSNAETAAVIAATRPFCIMGLLLCRCHADGFADSLLRSGARRRVFDDDQRRFLNTVFRLADAFGRLRRPAL